MTFTAKESIAHKTAKESLAAWLETATDDGDFWRYPLRDGSSLSWRPNGIPVFVEYPFCEDGTGFSPVWDEFVWDESVSSSDLGYVNACPTFDECVLRGLAPAFIADIALRHKGIILAVIEVVHKSPPDNRKIEFYRRWGIDLYTVNASWVLSQFKQPDSLLLYRI